MFRTYQALHKHEPGKTWFRVEAKSEEAASVYIYDEIGYYGVSASDFVKTLGTVTASTINLHINTPGGNVFDGIAIYNALVDHKAKVVTHIDGLAASMGSVIALAGDVVNMAENAMFMIHNPWSAVIGDAAAMRKAADVLDKIREGSLLGIYKKKTSIDEDELKSLMDAETWMTAEDAAIYGFIDNITGSVDAKADFDLSCFSNAPACKHDKQEERLITSDVRRKRLALLELE